MERPIVATASLWPLHELPRGLGAAFAAVGHRSSTFDPPPSSVRTDPPDILRTRKASRRPRRSKSTRPGTENVSTSRFTGHPKSLNRQTMIPIHRTYLGLVRFRLGYDRPNMTIHRTYLQPPTTPPERTTRTLTIHRTYLVSMHLGNKTIVRINETYRKLVQV